jgi:hypothetical protein
VEAVGLELPAPNSITSVALVFKVVQDKMSDKNIELYIRHVQDAIPSGIGMIVVAIQCMCGYVVNTSQNRL